MALPPFAENFDRLLGFHQLTADWAAPLLGVSDATVSYWRNGHREPDVASLKRLGEVFEIDPFALLATPFVELLPVIADAERFESVERRIVHEQYTGEVLPASRRTRGAKRKAAIGAKAHRIEEERHRPEEGPSPKGEILEVLGTPERPYYRVRWEDGRESVLTPRRQGSAGDGDSMQSSGQETVSGSGKGFRKLRPVPEKESGPSK